MASGIARIPFFQDLIDFGFRRFRRVEILN
jgi:hypothetical protein